MTSTFPTTLDALAITKANGTAMTTDHPAHHNDMADAVNKVEAKVGIGSSTPVANSVLAGSATGVSGWTGSPTLSSVALSSGVLGSSTNTPIVFQANSANTWRMYPDANATLPGTLGFDEGETWGSIGGLPHLFVRSTRTNPSGVNPTHNRVQFDGTCQGSVGVSSRMTGFSSTIRDGTGVNELSITAATNATPVVVTTASAHGYSENERVVIWAATGNTAINGIGFKAKNVTASTFDLYTDADVAVAGSGTYTGSGMVTNRPMYYCYSATVSPSVRRGGITGTAQFADDVAGYTLYNNGTKGATDGFYIGHNTGFSFGGSEHEWGTGFNSDAYHLYGVFMFGGKISDSGLNAVYQARLMTAPTNSPVLLGPNNAWLVAGVNAAASDSIKALKINTSDQIEFGTSTKLPNNTPFYGRNAAGSADVEMFRLNASNELGIAPQTRFTTHIVISNLANIFFSTSTGTKIGTGTGEKFAFHNSTPVAQRANASQAAVTTTAATTTTPFGFTTAAQADAIVTLVNELRAALVEKGLIKGAA